MFLGSDEQTSGVEEVLSELKIVNPSSAFDYSLKALGRMCPQLLNYQETLDFLKVHNESGKVTKFWTSRSLFSLRNSYLKK